MNKNVLSMVALAVLMLGTSAHAAFQSQTLLRLSNDGLIQTIPAVTVNEYAIYAPGSKQPQIVKNAALLYDKRNPLPALTVMGANYAFFSGGLMATVSENGSFNYKGKVLVQPGALGGNFFLNKDTSEIIAIDSAGFYNYTGKIANNIRLIGGNFYIDQAGTLTTIKHMGAEPGNPLGMVTVKEGYNFSDAVRVGGNFFVKVDGSVVGISSETGFFTMPQMVESLPKQLGGNYFISADNTLYTVSNEGVVKKQLPIVGEMKTFGYSYMIDGDGDFIVVDGLGNPHTEIVRVSSTGVKSELIKNMKSSLDPHQSFINKLQ